MPDPVITNSAVRGLAALLATGAALIIAAGAQAAGTVREPRPVADFDRVVLRAIGDLIVEQGDRETLVIEAERHVLAKTVTQVRDGILSIDMRDNVRTTEPVRYYLTVKRLHAVHARASGNVTVDRLRTEKLELLLAGSGDTRIGDLTTRSLQVGLTGSGEVQVSGKTETQSVRIAGSGDFDGQGFDSRTANVVISGSGNVRVRASADLDVEISGSGTVSYFGTPRVRKSIRGAGSVEPG